MLKDRAQYFNSHLAGAEKSTHYYLSGTKQIDDKSYCGGITSVTNYP